MNAVCSVELPRPPHHRMVAVLDEVVEPRLADLLRRQIRVAVVVLHRADEGEGAADVVVGDDQTLVEFVVDVIVDLAEAFLDALVGPALEGPAEVDADDLAEHARVDALLVVGWQVGGHGGLRGGKPPSVTTRGGNGHARLASRAVQER